MFYLYIIQSEIVDKYYIGFSSDIDGRIAAHNHPKNKGWTKRFQPWKLVYSETFESKELAQKREKQLKSFKNKYIIQKIINSK